jgi:hypothetical protein
MVTKKSTTERYAFLKFGLSSVAGTIASAKLRMYTKSVSGASNRSVYQVTTDRWIETGINWNNKPAYGSLLSTASISSVNTLIEWDVTSYLVAQLAGDKVASFCIRDPNMTDIGIDFYSKESSTNKPVLLVVASDVKSAAVLTIASITDAQNKLKVTDEKGIIIRKVLKQ